MICVSLTLILNHLSKTNTEIKKTNKAETKDKEHDNEHEATRQDISTLMTELLVKIMKVRTIDN